MHCKTCDYALWNLRTRHCPECGAHFKPSDFEFVPNSVQFRCPHCAQAYYGTGPSGHLVPRRFQCVKCDAAIHMDEMVLLPTEGVDEGRTRVARAPWIERDKRGFLGALFATIGMSMTRPGELIRGVPNSSPVPVALRFGVYANLFYTLVGGLPFVLLVMLPLLLGAGAARGGGVGGRGIIVLATIAFGWLIVLLGIALAAAAWATLAHVLLLATGGAPGGLRRTAQAFAYSSGANALLAIPCLGFYFAWMVWVWWAVSATIMVQAGHRVHGGRAAFAVLLPPMFLVGAGFGLIVLSAMLSTQAATSAASAAAQLPAPETKTQRVLDGVLHHAESNNGYGPAHVLSLVGAQLTPMDLVVRPIVGRQRSDPYTGYRTLTIGTPEERAAVAQTAADALSGGVIAYRVGDFVFTYPGANILAADPGLWVVVFSPDPDQPPQPWPPGLLVVGRADGVVAAPGPNPVQAVMDQNALRAKHGLPPLPVVPATVTHDAPAVRGDARP